MLTYPNIDPVAVTIGPFMIGDTAIGPVSIHWYGLMYLLAFASTWLLALYRVRQPHSILQKHQLEDLIVYGAVGAVVGGRCGYVLFYNFDYWLRDPLWLLRIWEGGMSFHGGLLGVLLAYWLYGRKINRPLLDITDFIAPLVAPGLGFGRLGNFIGQELWGRISDVPWAMYFPNAPGGPRHPSQLYQAFLEGVVLFMILYWFSAKPRPRAAVSALFLICYGFFRFLVEFVREPDAHLQDSLLLGWVTRGQLLSIPMIAIGALMLYWAYAVDRRKKASPKKAVAKRKSR